MRRAWNNLMCRWGNHDFARRKFRGQMWLECYRSDYCRGKRHWLY